MFRSLQQSQQLSFTCLLHPAECLPRSHSHQAGSSLLPLPREMLLHFPSSSSPHCSVAALTDGGQSHNMQSASSHRDSRAAAHLPARARPRPRLGGRPSSPEASDMSMSALPPRAPATGPLPAPGPLPATPWRSAGSRHRTVAQVINQTCRQGSGCDRVQATRMHLPAGTCLLVGEPSCSSCQESCGHRPHKVDQT